MLLRRCMGSQINLTSVYLTNFFGLLLTLSIIVCNKWNFKEKDKPNNLLFCVIVLILVSCIIDPFVFYSDGKDGTYHHLVIIYGNTWLFIANILCNSFWVIILANRLYGQINKVHLRILQLIIISSFVSLIINYFYPLVFHVNENNEYVRKSAYYIFAGANLGLLIDSFIDYLAARKRGGKLKFFPVWMYLLPVILGGILQTAFYGISLTWPCAAIAVNGIMNTFQNEAIYKDKLTGLYNRSYFEFLKIKAKRDKCEKYTVLILDINRFKSINDLYGRLSGDNALIATGKIIEKAAGKYGLAMRYSGDEFLVLLNTVNNTIVGIVINRLYNEFDKFNDSEKEKYTLSVSVGAKEIDINNLSEEEIYKEIDVLIFTT